MTEEVLVKVELIPVNRKVWFLRRRDSGEWLARNMGWRRSWVDDVNKARVFSTAAGPRLAAGIHMGYYDTPDGRRADGARRLTKQEMAARHRERFDLLYEVVEVNLSVSGSVK